MTIRHISTKLKPQLSDHLASWANYLKLFDFILNSSDADLCITTQWIYDITQEFAYQFQGFCQYRGQVANHTPENLRTLEANKDAWNLPTVMSILSRLIRTGRQQQSGGGRSLVLNSSPFAVQFGYFASIELARLECLLGDYSASLSAISAIKLNDRSELFMQLPICHFNVFYHTGVCNMMLRRFTEAMDIFSEIILHVARILKPGAATGLRAGVPQQLQRMMDKVLALTAIIFVLYPAGNRMDEQVKELVETKYSDKLRRLQAGDKSCYTDIFEFASPKFISPTVPDYSVPLNMNQDAFNHQVSVFMAEVQQHIAFLKLRSFLGLYASIDISKLSRFNDISEPDLICQLVSFKNKAILQRTSSSGAGASKGSASASSARVNITDVHYFIEDGVLVIDSASQKADNNKAHERYFIAGVRKHVEIINQLNRVVC